MNSFVILLGNKSDGDIDVMIKAKTIRAMSQRERFQGDDVNQMATPAIAMTYP